MKGKWMLGIGLALLVAAVGLAYGTIPGARVAYAGSVTEERGGDATPAQVVTDFYNWYLDYARGGEALRNPVVDGAYRSSAYLSEALIGEVDEMVAARERGWADPFLLAQDIPVRFTVGEATVAGDEASVALCFYWGGNPTPSPREVHLERIDGAWQIAGISIPEG